MDCHKAYGAAATGAMILFMGVDVSKFAETKYPRHQNVSCQYSLLLNMLPEMTV